MVITDNFKWDNHVEGIVSKASRTLGMIKHTLWKAPTKIKLLAYPDPMQTGFRIRNGGMGPILNETYYIAKRMFKDVLLDLWEGSEVVTV